MPTTPDSSAHVIKYELVALANVLASKECQRMHPCVLCVSEAGADAQIWLAGVIEEVRNVAVTISVQGELGFLTDIVVVIEIEEIRRLLWPTSSVCVPETSVSFSCGDNLTQVNIDKGATWDVVIGPDTPATCIGVAEDCQGNLAALLNDPVATGLGKDGATAATVALVHH